MTSATHAFLHAMSPESLTEFTAVILTALILVSSIKRLLINKLNKSFRANAIIPVALKLATFDVDGG